jgi:predicted flap endonuclease-1-like 5' DNA nuclease
MKTVENKNAPLTAGWLMAAAAGLVAFAVSKVIGGFDYVPSVFFGVVIFAVVGLILGFSWGGSAAAPVSGGSEAAKAAPVPAAPAPVAAPVAEAPKPAAPAPAAPAAVADAKPVGLAAPRDGVGDDLKTIEGIGPALEKLCHSMGIFHFDQIAAWGASEIAWMDDNLKGFKGRVTRDKWVAQAKLIGEVGIPEFLRRAKTNDY